MSRLRATLAVGWAALATPVVLATFVLLPPLASALVGATGIRISPWFTGGEVVRTIEHDGYRTEVHRPVFDGLVGEREQGFVQVEWTPAGPGRLPARVREAIDVDGDGSAEFAVDLDVAASRATVEPRSPGVLGLERVYDLGRARAVRVRLRRS